MIFQDFPRFLNCSFELNIRFLAFGINYDLFWTICGHFHIYWYTMFDNGIIRPDPLSAKPIELWKKYLRQGRVSEPIKTLRLVFLLHI